MIHVNRDKFRVELDDELAMEFRYRVVMYPVPLAERYAEGGYNKEAAARGGMWPGETLWFRYDDGWRYLPNGPNTTVDLEHLFDTEAWYETNDEFGLKNGKDGSPSEMLDALEEARS